MALLKSLTTTLTASLLLASLAACGHAPVSLVAAQSVQVKYQGDPEVESTTGLKGAFKRIHYAIFDSMDINHDKYLTEIEAGTHMTPMQFAEANVYNDGGITAHQISRTEFIDWCTHIFLWIHTTQNDWVNNFRSDLADVFDRLDADHDGLISRKELNPTALARINLTFKYPKLKIVVPIKKVDDAMFKASDKTNDAMLSQPEFEDMYTEMVVQALAPAAPPAPGPQPAPSAPPAPPAPPAPAAGGGDQPKGL